MKIKTPWTKDGDCAVRKVRYRTEAFSGTGERDAAEVMAFETFELGNTDILEHLRTNILKDPALIARCTEFIVELHNNGFVDDLGTMDRIQFFRNILDSIEKETGIRVNYALWLADKEAVTDREWYGRDMADELDFDSYEVGPVVLSDLGFDGTLYGYTEMPVPLEDRMEDLRAQPIGNNRKTHYTPRGGAPMDNETLNTTLYEKLFDENEKYKEWLLTLPPSEILEHAYAYTIRQDILLAMEYHEVTDEQAKALLASDTPLEDIFHVFEEIETEHMEVIRDCIEIKANELIQAQAEAARALSIHTDPEIKILSAELCPDDDYGESIIQYQLGDDFVSFAFSGIQLRDILADPQKAIEELRSELAESPQHPLWSDLSDRLRDLIKESDHDMLFVEFEDDRWIEELADTVWDEVCRHKLEGCVRCMEDGCYVTVYAGAIGSVNWSGEPQLGKPCLTEKITLPSADLASRLKDASVRASTGADAQETMEKKQAQGRD